MGQGSRGGAPRQSRTAGRPATGNNARIRNSGGRGPGGGGQRPGADGFRSAPAGKPGSQGLTDTAKLTHLIEPVLRALDMDLEAVKVAVAGRRRVLRIIVDADGGISLDDIAVVSREVSARLDARNAMGDAPYTLEVTSPGVDRPLTQPRHWRRSIGRLVVVPLTVPGNDSQRDAPADPVEYEARVIDADQDRVTLDVDGARRVLTYGELGPGRVQVEFGHLDDVGDVDGADGPGDLGDLEESLGGPDEEGPDGH